MITTALCLCALLAPQQTAGNTEAARKAIVQVLSDQIEAWNKGDLKGFMAGYQRSPDITFYSGGTIHKGWDTVLERYQKKYQGEGKEMGMLTFPEITVEVLSADSAVVRGRFELKTSKDMPSGLFTLIFRKTPQGWRIVHDHTSN
jgi:ketosteroid isomerase-like protein